MKAFLPMVLALASTGCGYHIAGHTDLMPKSIKTIAIPAFGNTTERSKLARLMAADVAREFIARTRYTIVANPDQADAWLQAALVSFTAYPTIFDPVSARATEVQVIAILQVNLIDRQTGKTIFSRPSFDFRERYQITVDPQSYFDESGTAIERLSRSVARSVVTAILENF